jgi:hypothetical protein
MNNDERIAALERQIEDQKRELADLKRKAEPPKPFTPEPFQRFDPTAGMSMPRSTLMEMAAAMPTPMVKAVVAEQRVSSVQQGPSQAGASGVATKTSSSPGLPGSTAWSQSGNAGRW